MRHKLYRILVFCVVVLAVSACNFGVPAPTSVNQSANILTEAAQTLQAQTSTPTPGISVEDALTLAVETLQAQATTTDTPAPPSNPPTSKPKPTKTPKPTATSTPGSGNPNPIIHPIPLTLVVKGQAPSEPDNVYANRDSCTTGGGGGATPTWIEHITVTWKDTADNEDGYRVYRGNVLLSTLPANSTKYTITMSYPQNSQNALYFTFGVEAYNTFGASAMPTWDVPSCP